MPRPKNDVPRYRYHVSGQARVTLDGRDFYLGEYDSPQSRAKYRLLVSQYLANDYKLPDETQTHLGDAKITVACVTAEFREHIKTKYANNAPERGRFQNLCTLLEDEYGEMPAEEFGPRKLSELRELFVASGNCRRYVNQQTRNLVRIFKYGVSREVVQPDRLVALESLEPLRFGQTKAKESKVVTAVDLECVKKTAEHLSPVLVAMVRVQASTGMRSGELCQIRPRDIEHRPDGVLLYHPQQHKTKHLGKRKLIPLAGDAAEAIGPFLDRKPDSFCFSPRESAAWYREQRTANRKTPLSCGTRVGDKCKASPKRAPREAYDSDSYRRAIKRATEKAGTLAWHPHQLRHTAASVIRDVLGIEYATAMLGHSSTAMTAHYAKLTEEKAIEAARVLGKHLSS